MIARAALAALLASLVTGCGGRGNDAPVRQAALNQAPGVRYVGRAVCTPCHAEKAASFAYTGMGRSWYPLTAASAIEDFRDRNVFAVPDSDLRYRMSERNGQFFMRQYVVDPAGREDAADEREMQWVAGSGNHSRSYVAAVGGKLFQLPVCWYPAISAWDLCPGYEHRNDYFGREISASCVFCHNARMEREPGSRNRFREPIPAGIDCERCHGPGELHVARWQKGVEGAGGGPDPTIVNPERLPAAERIQVCFQCHLADAGATERVGRHDRALEQFRPGERFSDVAVPFRFAEPLPDAYGIAGQADRFLLSRCYRESQGRIECLTCHDPHVTVYRKDASMLFVRQKCLGCHDVAACKAPSAARESTRPRDDCVRCHMRKAEPDDHRHAALTDHWIRRRIDEPGPASRARIDLEPILPVEFGQLSEADRAYYTGRAYFLKGGDLPASARRSALDRAATEFLRARQLGFTKVEGTFFLGKALLQRGREREAAEEFARAATLAPDYADAALAHGQSLLREGGVPEAAKVFEGILARAPDHAGALAELARCRVAENRRGEALDLYRRAIAIEPWKPALHANLALLLEGDGHREEALEALREAVRCAPGEAALWAGLSQALRDRGRRAEAEIAEARAARLRARAIPPEQGRGMMGL